ncbi:unnamed protein product [Microthlaspi erraticum]|uniref:CMP/dCMP-type deaminase domain-containing protein n=1 Tax=Microthlaspi erraticum TaxID=1685480 RepID=A0A6D2I110_9BRAS|nr:unnamed protein product [Microthlaspi erraticum]
MGEHLEFVLVGVSSKPSDLSKLIDRKVSLGLAQTSRKYAGAAGLGSSGVVYLGVNVEFPGLSLDYSIHAEQFVVANLALHSEKRLLFLAMSHDGSTCDAPCHRCRNLLQETRDPETKIVIKNPSRKYHGYVELVSLLEPRFVLGDTSLLHEPKHNGLTLLEPEICQDSDACSHLKCRALAAANKSCAPYSDCPSGVALKDRDGKVYRGWYMESGACEASLMPIQTAVVDFVVSCAGRQMFDNIVEAVLVEKKDARVSQVETTKTILKALVGHPNCVLKVFHFRKP